MGNPLRRESVLSNFYNSLRKISKMIFPYFFISGPQIRDLISTPFHLRSVDKGDSLHIETKCLGTVAQIQRLVYSSLVTKS